jgi:myosin heavy subunit
MEHLRQVTPIIEAFGNACIAHTHNSSRLGKYMELSFTKYGELVGGEVRTYLLENVGALPGSSTGSATSTCSTS